MASFLGKKEGAGWTAVDAGEGGLYGVTVLAPRKPGDKPRVVKCGAIPGGQLDAESLIGLAKKISVNGCPWTLPLNHKAYNILVIPEPAVLPNELDQSVRWSIGTMIDYPTDEASMAWMQIPTAKPLPNRPPHLYVVSAKNEIIAGYETLFRKAHIPLQAIDVRETAQRNIASLAEKPGEGVAMLLIGRQGVQFTVTFNGVLYLDRFIEESLFVQDLHDADAKARACERIVLQVQRSLDLIGRTLTFIDINRILMGPMPGNLDLGDAISQHLQVPVEPLDLASIFDFSQTPELAQEENQVLYFTALGAALRFMSTSQQINLQVQKKSGFDPAQTALAVLGLVLLSLLGLWGMGQGKVAAARAAEAVSALQVQHANAKLQMQTQQSGSDLAAKIAAIKPQAEAAQKILAQTGDLGDQQGYARHFSSLASITGDDLWLTNVTVDKAGKAVRISGRALHKESVMRYAQRLNDLFAGDGVQFTALELSSESAGQQGNPNAQLTAVAFKLY